MKLDTAKKYLSTREIFQLLHAFGFLNPKHRGKEIIVFANVLKQHNDNGIID
jgi:hypothetical protein